MFHVNLNYVDSRGRLKTGMCRSGGKINETFSVIKLILIWHPVSLSRDAFFSNTSAVT